MILELFIGTVIVLYFGVLSHMDASRVIIILLFSIIRICGSYRGSFAWYGIRVNTFANSRTLSPVSAANRSRATPFRCRRE